MLWQNTFDRNHNELSPRNTVQRNNVFVFFSLCLCTFTSMCTFYSRGGRKQWIGARRSTHVCPRTATTYCRFGSSRQIVLMRYTQGAEKDLNCLSSPRHAVTICIHTQNKYKTIRKTASMRVLNSNSKSEFVTCTKHRYTTTLSDWKLLSGWGNSNWLRGDVVVPGI